MNGQGLPVATYPGQIELYICAGQSLSAGRGYVPRIANTQYNYIGISELFPATRTTQAAYPAAPANVKVYWKGNTRTGNYFVDNGVLQDLVAGTNSNPDGAGNFFNEALSLGYQIATRTGNIVVFDHSAFGGTSLIPGTPTGTPGNQWPLLIQINFETYLKRLVRDIKIAYPGYKINLRGIIWRQAETDAANGATKVEYMPWFRILADYAERRCMELFALDAPPKWFIGKLNFNNTPAEASINEGFAEFCALRPTRRTMIDVDAFPKKQDQTAAMNAPSGTVASDDNHPGEPSYYAFAEIVTKKDLGLSTIL